ncbi:hypothetical protein [Marinivivus vitaminiproducens]|uniref:hypothetical protein n=1 Tax=Marinivivus vitaminiproducens TaxID=3035935 RepID=UPI0027AB74F0|nr:hypothetical protein P4R82_19245 [Geminicoccaceae bacterium SCSIO 64248]
MVSPVGSLFGLKMAVCMAVFLLGALWLHRRIARVKAKRGLPPSGSGAAATLAHFLKPAPSPDRGIAPSGDAMELLLLRQTVRVLARDLLRRDPGHEEARAGLALVGARADIG